MPNNDKPIAAFEPEKPSAPSIGSVELFEKTEQLNAPFTPNETEEAKEQFEESLEKANVAPESERTPLLPGGDANKQRQRPLGFPAPK